MKKTLARLSAVVALALVAAIAPNLATFLTGGYSDIWNTHYAP